MKAKSIMIQGTASSVGKSIIAAGLCRIFKQDGYKVSPFKSQNMALNSYITCEGKEMGRAQAVQAEAAGTEPTVKMNPILLKPTSDRKAQVIINGKVYGNMSAEEYHCFKPKLASMIKVIYESLASQNDIVVIEGAGSPAEINLRDGDIVNMGMAEIADSPVILAGDIDKGGVFASLAGTMLLLTEEERKRVKGVIINKFRGDMKILQPGIKMIEDIINVPVIGVIPYMKLNIDDEDSLTERFCQKMSADKTIIDIAVIKLPRISNFTDFNALENYSGVSIRYVDTASRLKDPDLIILPGSKNTIEDLIYIRNTGIEAEILKRNKDEIPVLGICGGYQMLGQELKDPYEKESSKGSIEGMGLLNIKTIFQHEKVTTQAEAVIIEDTGLMEGLKGVRIKGYEIHMGTTDYSDDSIPFIKIDKIFGKASNLTDGASNKKGTVYGTYIHGLFDNHEFTNKLLNNLRRKKGIGEQSDGESSFKDYKEKQYDVLAKTIREHINMERIYEIMKINLL